MGRLDYLPSDGRQNRNCDENAFDILRYYAVICVMLGHFTYYWLCYAGETSATVSVLNVIPTLFPGVVILFTISGYLVSGSMERSRERKGSFLLKRLGRLYPELWVCALVTLLSLLILVPQALDESMFLWAGTQVMGVAYTPSCLKGYGTGSVNGALWTVFAELQLYIVLMVGYRWLSKLRAVGWTICIAGALLINVGCEFVSNRAGDMVSKLVERSFLPYFVWFVIGCMAWSCRPSVIPVLRRLTIPLIFVYLILRVMHVSPDGYYVDVITSFMVPFIVLGLAYLLPPVRLGTDISYGLFLYHWIVLNVFVELDLIRTLPWPVSLALMAGVSVVLAWLSGHYVGKPASVRIRTYLKTKNIA